MSSVSISSAIRSSSYWSKLAGGRWPFFLSLVILFILSYWLRNEYGQDDSNLWIVMKLFLLLVQATMVGLFAVGLLSVLITWIYFLSLVKNKRVTLQAKFGDGQKAEAGWVPVSVMISGNVL